MAKKTTPEAKTAPEEKLLTNAFEREIGISSRTLKKIFDRSSDGDVETIASDNKKWLWSPSNYDPKYSKKQGDLVARIRSLLKDTYTRNFSEYPVWAAADTAWVETASSTTPTLLNKLMAGTLKDDDLLASLKNFQINEQEAFEPLTAQNSKSALQAKRVRKAEAFVKVRLPIAKAVVMARVSRLFAERDRDPLFPLEPSEWTEENQIQCEVLTGVLSKIVNQYGLRNRIRQSFIQSGKYNQQLVIFSEAWAHEEVMVGKEKKTVKEGVRLLMPHPTRCGWDLVHNISSFNTDTGCEWAMHWRLMRWHDIQSNPDYWNKNRVSYGSCWLHPQMSGSYFNEFYPHVAHPEESMLNTWYNSSLGQDREQRVMFYAGDQTDMPIFITEMMMKLVPKDWEVGDYDCPVWFRFVVAGDQSIIYAEPLPDCPVMFLGLDTDEALASNISLLIESLPHQDFINNLLTQHRYTVNQNLSKIVFYDKFGGGADEKTSMDDIIKSLKAEGTDVNRVRFVPFDGRRLRQAGLDAKTLFAPITFGQQDTTQIITAINIYLGLMERVLGLSANEMGSTAPRITTAAETANVANVGNLRASFTGSYVDDFMDTLARRIVRYWQAFGDKEFRSSITEPSEEAVALLKKMGFNVGEVTRLKNGSTRVSVSGTRKMIDVDEFVASKPLSSRMPTERVASVMMQLLTTAIPFIADGSSEARQQIIDGLNRIARLLSNVHDLQFFAPPKPKDKNEQGQGNYRKLIESMSFKDVPLDSQQFMLQQAGLPPSKFIDAQIKQATEPQSQQQPVAQAGPPPIEQIAAQIQQMTLQKVDQQLAPVMDQIKKQFQQVMVMISQGKQTDEQFGQHIAQLEQAVTQIAGILNQPPAPPPPQQMPPQ